MEQEAKNINWRKGDKVICDGCNVNYPFEHRCHGNKSVIMGEYTNFQCQCPVCRESDKIFKIR